MKEKVKLINKLITTFNDAQTRSNLKKQPRSSAYSMWGDSTPEERNTKLLKVVFFTYSAEITIFELIQVQKR